MNSTEKGDKFEHKVYLIFSEILKNNNFKIKLRNETELEIVPKTSSIQQKVKKQFTYGDYVINDLTIENDKPNNLLVLVECKCYESAVDRGEIFEFYSRSLFLKATKGIFVTSSRFQQGAINAAKECNIALVRINEKENDHVTWDLYRLGSTQQRQIKLEDLLTADISNKKCAIMDGKRLFDSLPNYLGFCLNIIPQHIKSHIPYLSKEQIQSQVLEFVNSREYNIMTDELLFLYALMKDIPIETKHDCKGYLGIYDFLNNKIYISSELEDVNLYHRKRFTIAHELGHAILHRPALKEFIRLAQDTDLIEFSNTPRWMKALEVQANIFASYLLMPKIPFISVAMEIKSKLGISIYEPFYLDTQECNIRICSIAIETLSSFFHVSKWAVKIRLKEENLLKEKEVNTICNIKNNTLYERNSY